MRTRRAAPGVEVALLLGFAAGLLAVAPNRDLSDRPVLAMAAVDPATVRALVYQQQATQAVRGVVAGLAVVRVSDGQLLALATSRAPSSSPSPSPSLAYQVGLRPGSSLKPYFYAAALDADRLPADEPIASNPCADGPWQEAIAQSCNTRAVAVAESLGLRGRNALVHRLDRALRSATTLGPRPRWAPSTADHDSIVALTLGGGETRVTPLHLALLMAGIARDGTVPGSTAPMRVMSRRAAASVRPALVAAADHGTARRLKGYNAAAKTGTADERGTKDGWVSGFWPADNPQLAFAVVALGSPSHWVTGRDEPSLVATRFLRSLASTSES